MTSSLYKNMNFQPPFPVSLPLHVCMCVRVWGGGWGGGWGGPGRGGGAEAITQPEQSSWNDVKPAAEERGVYACVCKYVCVSVCMRVYACMCVRACV